jgi:hypothetical protein
MKRISRKLGQLLAVLTIIATGSLTAAAPATASPGDGPVCILLQNTWLRDGPWNNVILTLHAGRGFRIHARSWNGNGGDPWLYGHGAEAPDLDGWIPAWQCQ